MFRECVGNVSENFLYRYVVVDMANGQEDSEENHERQPTQRLTLWLDCQYQVRKRPSSEPFSSMMLLISDQPALIDPCS